MKKLEGTIDEMRAAIDNAQNIIAATLLEVLDRRGETVDNTKLGKQIGRYVRKEILPDIRVWLKLVAIEPSIQDIEQTIRYSNTVRNYIRAAYKESAKDINPVEAHEICLRVFGEPIEVVRGRYDDVSAKVLAKMQEEPVKFTRGSRVSTFVRLFKNEITAV